MGGDNDRRQSDVQLMLLQQKLEEHIDEYKQHCEDEDGRWEHLIAAQERNTQSIDSLIESTRDLVAVWQAADGTMKTMSVAGRFVKWLSGFAVLGVAFKWIADHLRF